VQRRFCALGALVVTAALALAGCGEQKQPSGSPATGGGTVDRTFSYADNNETMVGWDPATSYSNENIAMSNMYEQLVRWNSESGEVEPLLAESWTKAEDGTRWTFKLREGVKFHTGRAMDAKAAKAAILRTKELNQGAGYIWGPVKKISTPDAATLVFDLDYAAPLDLIASSGYAAYIYDTTAAPAKGLAKWFEKGQDAGTGPYTVGEWNKGAETELRLEKFEDYWRGWDDEHYQRVVFRHVPRDTTAAQLLESGDVTFVSRLSPQLWERAKGMEGVKATSSPSFQNMLALFNTASGPMKDVRVRKAVSLALDYEGLLSALKGGGIEAHGVIPEGLIGYDESLTNAQDLEQAKSLLAEAGYGPGKKSLTVTMTHAEGDEDETLMASIWKSNLADLNVKLDVRPLQWTSQWDRAKSGNVEKRQDIFVMFWYPDYADPYSWFINVFRSADPPFFNLSYIEDAELDKTIDSMQELTATDEAAAEAAYKKAQQILIDEAAVATPFVQTYLRAMRDEFDGWVDNPAYGNVVHVYDVTPK
jgi:peptide/nickel transport system substrate-binding protein